MKAVVLAGGFAKRLWPVTLEVAKPLLKVADRPVLDYLAEELGIRILYPRRGFMEIRGRG